MKVRKAVIGEEKRLIELAFRSKAYWGYDNGIRGRDALSHPKNLVSQAGGWGRPVPVVH